jgi:hypothetical protein
MFDSNPLSEQELARAASVIKTMNGFSSQWGSVPFWYYNETMKPGIKFDRAIKPYMSSSQLTPAIDILLAAAAAAPYSGDPINKAMPDGDLELDYFVPNLGPVLPGVPKLLGGTIEIQGTRDLQEFKPKMTVQFFNSAGALIPNMTYDLPAVKAYCGAGPLNDKTAWIDFLVGIGLPDSAADIVGDPGTGAFPTEEVTTDDTRQLICPDLRPKYDDDVAGTDMQHYATFAPGISQVRVTVKEDSLPTDINVVFNPRVSGEDATYLTTLIGGLGLKAANAK